MDMEAVEIAESDGVPFVDVDDIDSPSWRVYCSSLCAQCQ